MPWGDGWFPRKALLVLVLVLGGLLAHPLPVSAAVRFDMFVGYDGVVPQGSWFPVEFEVQNDGPAFTGIVEVLPGQFNSTQTRTMVVELPTGTTKRFVIPAFAIASYNPTWSARLLDEKGRVRAPEAISQRLRRYNDSVLPMAGAMTRTMPSLPEMKSRQEDMRPVFARLQTSVFPDNPLALEGLDTIYLASERALELKANQVGALLAWLYGGGHLIVGLEQINHLNGSGEWLKRLLPGEATGMSTRPQHGEIQSWLVGPRRFDGSDFDANRDTAGNRRNARNSLNPYEHAEPDVKFEAAPMQVVDCAVRGGRVLMGTPAAPLAVIAKRGRGQITVLAFAPELEPFRSWKHADLFWAKMIDLPAEVFSSDNVAHYGGRPIDGVVGAMIDSEQVRKLPVGWLLLLLVAYLVVIGPLDQYWLKKLNRQMLTWITFPAYVLFFSLLIYFIGYKLRAGETEWTELHILDVTSHGESADLRGRSFGSIYSPVNARYAFGSDEPFATWRGEFSGNYGGGQDTGRGTVEQRPAGFRATAPVPVWTSQLFVSDWWRQGPAPVKVEVTASEVTVDNDLDAPLTDVRLIQGGQILELGDLAAQERKTFTRRNARNSSLSSFVQNESANFQHVIGVRHQAFGDASSGRIRVWPEASLALSFMTLVNTPNNYNNFIAPPGFDLARLVQRGDAVLTAWVANYSPTKPLNHFSARRGKKNMLLRVAVPME